MSLRYALLALLTATPATGYDLTKAFASSVGHVWHAPDSQIYPELRRMSAEGLVAGTAVPWGPRGTKTRYDVTAAGETALRDWMSEPVVYHRDRDPAHLHSAYLEFADPAAARELFRAHAAHHEELRAQWQAQLDAIRSRTHPVVAARLRAAPESEHRRIVAYKAHTYEGLVARADHEIEWARRGLALVDDLEGPEPGADPPGREGSGATVR